MSRIEINAVVATASMWCNARGCGRTYRSAQFRTGGWTDGVDACQSAFDAGWRVYSGGRQAYTYCPDHGPKVEMRQIYPRPVTP